MQTNNPVVIRKYNNRKLYNTFESHYITCNDVIDLIKRDIPFTVIMHKTNENVTKEVLLASLSKLDEVTEQDIINFVKRR
jgi:polyhydroxyalkanoate synthesis regulator protein